MIARNLSAVLNTLPEGVQLVAVSKFHPIEALQQAYDAGQRLFGESRVQELTEKRRHLPADIRWHFIGHLQTNKVRQLIGKVDMIESVDSDRLLRLIDKESAAAGVVTAVLLQVHVAAEETKFGFLPDELSEWFRSGGYTTLKATHICGLMAMARIKAENPDLRGFDILSMGMSHDYPIAIAEGATHVRVGSAIFGERKY